MLAHFPAKGARHSQQMCRIARRNYPGAAESEKKVRQALFYARELVFSYDLH